METITYCFKIDNLISPEIVEGETISFVSPHYPSIEKDKDFIEGELEIDDQNVQKETETIKNCLELTCALLNQKNFPITLKRHPPSLDLIVTGHSTDTLKEPKEFEKFFNKSLLLLSQDNHWFNYAKNWFMRSNKAIDIFDKFIYSWITFECLYGCLYNKAKSNFYGIKSLIDNNIPESRIQEEIVEKHKETFIHLSSLSLKDIHNDTNWSEKLKNSLTSNDVKNIIKNGVMAIAMIRNSIFHGNLLDRNHEANKCFSPLNHLNSEIIKKIMFKS